VNPNNLFAAFQPFLPRSETSSMSSSRYVNGNLIYLSREYASRIALALQELAREVLPSLQNLFLFLEDLDPSGTLDGAIGNFVAARQLTGHPIAISHWDGR
jgi:hypothetical protein